MMLEPSLGRALRGAALAGLVLATGLAQAHKASDAYIALQVDGAEIAGRVDIALRDLDRDLDLDLDADDTLTWKEVRSRWPDIAALARGGLRLSADGQACASDPAQTPATPATAPAITEHSDGHYAVLRLHWHCPADVHRLDVAYTLFARTDPTHRGIVRVGSPGGGAPKLGVLDPGGAPHRFTLASAAIGPAAASSASASGSTQPADAATVAPSAAAAIDSTRAAPRGALPVPRLPTPDTASPGPADDADAAPSSFAGFVREGIHHILIGYDHILFLLSLLLPAVWVRRPAQGAAVPAWRPAPALGPALANVLKVVTAFTVAHSITLALSVFDIVDPPSRWVESIIAASVVLAALNNLWPVISESRWKLTFVFGLVHGFGFASALKDAGLARGELAGPLVGFNLGVEIGQLCIVALVLPLAWSLRGTRAYRGAFAAGSLAIAVVAGLWLTQRAFDLSIIAG